MPQDRSALEIQQVLFSFPSEMCCSQFSTGTT